MSVTVSSAQLTLDLFGGTGQREVDIAVIHRATGWYTVPPEIDAVLDELGWPHQGQRLLDPGCGNGGFLVAALGRLDLTPDEIAGAADRVRGFEFHAGACAEARANVRAHLIGRGWAREAARRAAAVIVEQRDFLLDEVPAGQWDVIAGNPPYWRLANIPGGYRADFEVTVPAHAAADLLYAFLHQCTQVIAPGGRIGVITADRWLLNDGSGQLREHIGRNFTVEGWRRLDSTSAFYAAKTRRAGTAPRVHAVSVILAQGGTGQALTRDAFRLARLPDVDGVPLRDLAEIRLAPWVGPDGIFIVGEDARLPAFIAGPGPGLPERCLVPVIEPRDLRRGVPREAKRAIVTTRDAEPPPAILAHLDATLHRMPPRGRNNPRWLPPEPFAGKLPLGHEAVVVPRIAKRLTGLRLAAGVLPINHQLVVVSGLPADLIIAMLDDPLVQAQTDALALGIDNGYRSYTATLLRNLIIPGYLVQSEEASERTHDERHNAFRQAQARDLHCRGDDRAPQRVGARR